MIVYLKTWRYSIVSTNVYHGSAVKVDTDNGYFHVVKPVLEEDIGELTSVTIVQGDEFTIVQCENCKDHPEEPTQEKAVDFAEEPIARRSWMH